MRFVGVKVSEDLVALHHAMQPHVLRDDNIGRTSLVFVSVVGYAELERRLEAEVAAELGERVPGIRAGGIGIRERFTPSTEQIRQWRRAR